MLGRIALGALGLLAVALGLFAAALAVGAIATALIATRVERQYPSNGHFVLVSGGRLSLLEAGPVHNARGLVVLLHGASANASDPMEGFGRQLAEKGFRVLSFDRPGFGWSDRVFGSEAASSGVQAALIAEALDHLGVGPAIVYGHSWAGALALRMALDRPDRVAGLLLAAPAAVPYSEGEPAWWLRLALKPAVTRLLVGTIAVPLGLAYLPGTARAVFRPEAMVPDYVERSRARLILRRGAALANIQDLVGLPAAIREQAPRYAGLRVPTTVIAGDADPVVATALQAVPLASAVPGAKLVMLPGVGHMLHYTAPGAIVAEIEALRARLEAPSR